jgi:CRISPR/Cas system-associated exonuclease Cas4 (RecB family)
VNPTGSSLPLLRKCGWWARPEVVAPPQPPATDAMRIGNEAHLLIESALTGKGTMDTVPSDEALSFFDTWREWWATSPLSAEKWQAEVAYAYNPTADSARQIGVSMARKYEVNPGEIAGTIDALALDDEHATIVDWKTGDDFARMTADASENWQLRFYALAVARAHKVDSVRVLIVRIGSNGVRETSHALDALELDAVAAEIASLVAAVPSSEPRPGTHCRRCKVVALCPTTTVAQTALVATEPKELKISSQEQATALLSRLRQVQAACDQMELLLKEYAANNGGIALDNGKKWTLVPQDRESISLNGPDYPIGMAALEAAGATSAVETKASTSKAAIERALKAQGLKGKELREKMEYILSDLRAAGVVRTVTVDAWREV